jgi:mono/diheme cytochrome c family protein
MWNHAAAMKEEFVRRKISWPRLGSQSLANCSYYLRSLPATRNAGALVEISAGARGKSLFQSKGCASCHTGKLSLASLIRGQTLTDIAAPMWNHEPLMAANPPQLDWAEQVFTGSGEVPVGRRVFTPKHCATCHNDPSSGAPNLASRSFDAATMISALMAPRAAHARTDARQSLCVAALPRAG